LTNILKTNKMNYIIPAILGIACLIIIYVSLREYQIRKRNKALKEWFEQKQRYEIEAKVRQTIEHKANWWDNFNTDLYVKFLENR